MCCVRPGRHCLCDWRGTAEGFELFGELSEVEKGGVVGVDGGCEYFADEDLLFGNQVHQRL